MTLRLSASSIRDYIDCPRKLFYRVNFPELSVSTQDMIVGKIIHRAAEKFLFHETSLISYCENESKKSLHPQYHNKLMLCAMNLVTFAPLLSSNAEIEKKFSFDINGIQILGRMDRVDNRKTVIDWKTSAKFPKSIDNDVQFIIYSRAFKEIYGYSPDNVLYISLFHDKVIRYFPDERVENDIINDVVAKAHFDFTNNKLSPTGMLNNKCSSCAFRMACFKDTGVKNVLDSSTSTDGYTENQRNPRYRF